MNRINLVILFVLLNVSAITLFVFTINLALLSAVLLFITLSGSGLLICNKLASDLNDRRVSHISELWLLKCLVTLLLLYLGWMPELDPTTSSNWGYDPQRYYQDSWNLVLQNWNPETLEQNYQGIIYFYAVVFYVFGHNPIIPAIINSFLTLLGTVFLIRSTYYLMPGRTKKDWMIIFLLIVPEVLWYDVLTSRENLNMILFAVAVISFGNFILGINKKYVNLFFILISTILVIFIRTSILFSIALSFIMIFVLVKTKTNKISKFIVVAITGFLFSVGPVLQSISGGYNLNYLYLLDSIQTGTEILKEGEGWTNNSIGALLIPNNFIQSVIFTLPRGIIYLIAPLPNVSISLIELLSGSYKAWQGLMTFLTSILYILFFPLVLTATKFSFKNRYTNPSLLIIPIAFWSAFLTVAGGNLIIVERYRILFTLFFFLSSWIGFTRGSLMVTFKFTLLWCLILAFLVFSYFVYKLR
jgi:hypothetical protein